MSYQIVGKCSLCGGRVILPTIWWGVVPPRATCEKCGAVEDQDHNLPVIPMKRLTTTYTSKTIVIKPIVIPSTPFIPTYEMPETTWTIDDWCDTQK
jgi:hypothetical protein